jgi:hypothetical protein
MGTTITHAELRLTGLSAPDIATLLAEGVIHRLRFGVYAHELEDDQLRQHHALVGATCRVVDPSCVVSHTSAAALHGLPVRRDALGLVTMTRTSGGHADKSRHLHMRDTRISEEEIQLLDGRRVTTLPRTVADLARTEAAPWGVAAVDAALRLGCKIEDLRAALAAQPRLHGLRRARAVVGFGSGLAESPAESISRWNMSVVGFPAPVLQHEFFDEQGEFIARSDFYWPDFGLVGEVDGRVKYGELLRPGQSPEDVVMAEKQRENRLRGLGLWVVRWDWPTATSPTRLEAVLTAALRSHRRG